MSKRIEALIIHASATPSGREVTKQDLEQWHLVGRGWDRLGYSDLIHLNGEIENVTPYNDDEIIQANEITWGAIGYNATGRHVVYAGGTDAQGQPKDTRTPEQYVALAEYVKETIARYPWIVVGGHRDTYPDTDGDGIIGPHEWYKACPSFDVGKFLEEIGIPEYYMHYKG